jgi:hypothetical protein
VGSLSAETHQTGLVHGLLSTTAADKQYQDYINLDSSIQKLIYDPELEFLFIRKTFTYNS